jgi:hypothetical protein
VANESNPTSRRRFWRIVLLVLVILPLLPEIVVLSVSAIAHLRGCRIDGSEIDTAGGQHIALEIPADPEMVPNRFAPAPGSAGGEPPRACAIGPFAVSSIIRVGLKGGFFVGASFSSGVVVVWLALCYVSITRGWTGFLSRLMLAFFVSLIFSFVPYRGPMMSIEHHRNPHCQPNEGGAGYCVIYGGDVGSIVHYNIALGWKVIAGVLVAFGAFGIYVLFLVVVGIASRRRAAGRSAKSLSATRELHI